MAQRTKTHQNAANFDMNCETFMTRYLRREKAPTPVKPNTPSIACTHKCKERSISTIRQPTAVLNNQISKMRPNVRQQNILATKQPNKNFVQYTADDSAFVEVTVKTNPRQRTKSNAGDREPWSQLLKSNRTNGTTFSNFDPLRTLHFLAKELQFQLQNVLPDDNNLTQIVVDMQQALRRVPPEVASTIHLSQGLALQAPINQKSSIIIDDEKPEKLEVIKPYVSEKITQTLTAFDDNERIQKVMEESTFKLEASCQQLERLCSRLKIEKEELEKELQNERESVIFWKKRSDDLETHNKELIDVRIKKLENEKSELQIRLEGLSAKLAESVPSNLELRSITSELKQQKMVVEQECTKLRHQLRLSDLEKEKYIAVLSVRDRQINEIRNEMTQLQEVVNDQLMELHNNAFACMPSNISVAANSSALWISRQDKENVVGEMGDGTPSTLQEGCNKVAKPDSCTSIKEVPSVDSVDSSVLQELTENVVNRAHTNFLHKENSMPKINQTSKDSSSQVHKPASHPSVKDMFSDLKRQAFALSNTQSNTSNKLHSYSSQK